ncbi:MAG: transcriptional regulator, partial [Halomonas sp.]|nr:transcriptional regulator [Halomonas sp.]
RQAETTADPALIELAEELKGYPIPAGARPHLARATSTHGGIVVPLELAMPDGRVLSLLSTTTVFGTPLDITLEELAIESFFPADATTQEALQQLAAASSG